MYTPMHESHLHGISEPVCRCLRASLPDMRATCIYQPQNSTLAAVEPHLSESNSGSFENK